MTVNNLVILTTIISWVLMAPATAFAQRAQHIPSYPLKNGDFSTYQGWSRPAGWLIATEAGKHRLTVDPLPRYPTQRSAAAVVRTDKGGQGYVWQTVQLLAGEWRLRAEAAGSAGAKAQLEVSRSGSRQSKIVALTNKFQTLELEIPGVSGDTGVHLRFYSPTGGTVRFRNARLEAIRLESQPVPIEGGERLGGLVLPEKPTPAERYAGHELQRYIHQMTGKVPGIVGRDKTYSGRRIIIGGPAAAGQLKNGSADSYLIRSDKRRTALAGITSLATLYAVYDYLGRQGCYWITPGAQGEVIPQRKALAPVKSEVVSPDFALVRSVFAGAQQFFPGGGWIYLNMDDYRDWAVRNRFNSIWSGGATVGLRADRGHGWTQNSGHSWNATIAPYGKYFAKHPQWYPLVNGKRMPRSDVSIRLPNQLCVSNQQLRDYTVATILKYFKENPRARMFPMNPMDGPNYNCECKHCRALDPPGYEWNQDFSDFPRFPNLKLPPLADRYLNYVNHVAARVAKVHPDKLIEFYNYASRIPPSREKVHPNVSIKFTYLSGREVNVSLMDGRDPLAGKERRWLSSWSKSGTKNFTYYPYTDWENPDAAIHWYFNISDLLRNLKNEYGCVGMMGETHTTVWADPMWWGIYARLLWDTKTDYKRVIRELCVAYFGPAGREMTDFYLAMDAAVLHREGTRPAKYHPNRRLEFSLQELMRGRKLLLRATPKVQGNPRLLRRVDQARFAHAQLTLVRIQNMTNKSSTATALKRQALNDSNTLRAKYTIMVGRATQNTLQQLNEQR